MAELLVRVGSEDAALITRVLAGPPSGRPDRLVIDAHVGLSAPPIALAATTAGIPFLVDPQTFYWQDYQHPADAWAQLGFGDARVLTPSDLLRAGVADMLTARVIEHQLACGATTVIAPYVHVEREADGWAEVQVALWRATRRYVDATGLALPIVAILALGWRLLDRGNWGGTFLPLRTALATLDPAEIALAASKVDMGTRPEDRLASMVSVIRRLIRDVPVIAWNQGVLGEAAVAAGAKGYETGIGWRERCNVGSTMAGRRRPRFSGGNARPVYIDALRRAIPKKSVETLGGTALAASLVCLDGRCCPAGRSELMRDQRAHAIAARVRSLRALTIPAHPAWQWKMLACAAADGIDLAARINTVAERTGITRVDDAALRATLAVADNRRQTIRRSAA